MFWNCSKFRRDYFAIYNTYVTRFIPYAEDFSCWYSNTQQTCVRNNYMLPNPRQISPKIYRWIIERMLSLTTVLETLLWLSNNNNNIINNTSVVYYFMLLVFYFYFYVYFITLSWYFDLNYDTYFTVKLDRSQVFI